MAFETLATKEVREFVRKKVNSASKLNRMAAHEFGWNDIQIDLVDELWGVCYASKFAGSYDDFFEVSFFRDISNDFGRWAPKCTTRFREHMLVWGCEVDPIHEPESLAINHMGAIGTVWQNTWIEFYSSPFIVLNRDVKIHSNGSVLCGNIGLKRYSCSEIREILSRVGNVCAQGTDAHNVLVLIEGGCLVYQGWWEYLNQFDPALPQLGNCVQVFGSARSIVDEISVQLEPYVENVWHNT
ncbi:MAG: hypothetical protein ACK57P_16175 [Planctomycetota bacterium]|jgi:hypothetical protein